MNVLIVIGVCLVLVRIIDYTIKKPPGEPGGKETIGKSPIGTNAAFKWEIFEVMSRNNNNLLLIYYKAVQYG